MLIFDLTLLKGLEVLHAYKLNMGLYQLYCKLEILMPSLNIFIDFQQQLKSSSKVNTKFKLCGPQI